VKQTDKLEDRQENKNYETVTFQMTLGDL